MISNTPPTKQKDQNGEMYLDIIDGLCSRYMGLSPIELMNSDIKDVFDLYVYAVLKGYKKEGSQKADQGGAVWVTSKTATWH